MEAQQERTVRVVIIEDHDDFREGMYRILEGTEGFRCAGKYASIEEALPRMPECDVLLLDINLPGKSGIEGLPSIKAKRPHAQVIMLTVYEDDSKVFESIRAGADGYILKKTPPAKILQAVEEAFAGGMPMTPFVARQAINLLRQHLPREPKPIDFTPREFEILRLLAEGLNYSIIGERLFISIDTVRNHIRHIYEKLKVHSKAEAVAQAMKRGIL